MTLNRLKFGMYASTGNTITIANNVQSAVVSPPPTMTELAESV
jgi:hypothetical protein